LCPPLRRGLSRPRYARCVTLFGVRSRSTVRKHAVRFLTVYPHPADTSRPDENHHPVQLAATDGRCSTWSCAQSTYSQPGPSTESRTNSQRRTEERNCPVTLIHGESSSTQFSAADHDHDLYGRRHDTNETSEQEGANRQPVRGSGPANWAQTLETISHPEGRVEHAERPLHSGFTSGKRALRGHTRGRFDSRVRAMINIRLAAARFASGFVFAAKRHIARLRKAIDLTGASVA